MSGWGEFALAFAAFFLSHSIPLRPPIRAALRRRLGAGGFGLIYSVLSLVVLGWLIAAAGRAPFVEVWPRAGWQTHATLALMLPVCLLLGLSIGRANPLSFGGPQTGFDPDRPGIVRLVRHPVLAALAFWAVAHLLPNGDLAHVLLFGTFALFALLGRRLVDRRKRRELGADWEALRRRSRQAPLALELHRLMAGIALYAGLIAAHPLVIGVSPLP